MNLWPFKRAERRDADPSWAALIDQSGISAAGLPVNVKSAESLSAVFGCVQALSESTACLPLHVYQRTEGTRQRADDTALSRVLDEPNPYESGIAFRESMTAAVLLHGNAYAERQYNAAGELTALLPLAPQRMSVVKLATGRYIYDYTDDNGHARRLLQDEIFHLRDRVEPGSIVGRSRIAIARDTLGLSLGLREHGAATFKNGTRLSGILSTDRELQTEQASALTDAWRKYVGAGNSGKTFMLPKGVSYHQLQMNLEDAQWIAAQQFGVEEVCRIFRVPPTMVADLRNGNYSNTLELGSQFVRYSLQRWINMWESEISRQLLGPIARRRYYAEHSVEGLLRGNSEARADFYGKAIKDGWMVPDEVRKLENLPPLSVPQDDDKSLPPG